jgi:acyl carrier protein
VPVGVYGELCAGGDGLARGYLDQPELTAERFVPSPFGAPGARLYRTGDIVRHLPDGGIEFLGRRDGQVKVRGFRVELAEVEAALQRCPGVGQAAAALHGEAGKELLVGYVVARRQPPPTQGELRAFLQGRLPTPMVPTAWVYLEGLPLTPNGKVDRRALPPPDGTRPGMGAEFVAPRSPLEEMLVEIWTDVLGLERVGVHDNFFEVGGHSLNATQVIAQLHEELELELPLRSLFESPTIAELAVSVVQKMAEQAGEEALFEVLAEAEAAEA